MTHMLSTWIWHSTNVHYSLLTTVSAMILVLATLTRHEVMDWKWIWFIVKWLINYQHWLFNGISVSKTSFDRPSKALFPYFNLVQFRLYQFWTLLGEGTIKYLVSKPEHFNPNHGLLKKLLTTTSHQSVDDAFSILMLMSLARCSCLRPAHITFWMTN